MKTGWDINQCSMLYEVILAVRRRGKKQAIVTSQERFLASMVANLRSARVERCQAKMDAMSRIETARSLFFMS
ncbi:hypothetical protein AAGY65_14495, partial [Staphylococcus aureus]